MARALSREQQNCLRAHVLSIIDDRQIEFVQLLSRVVQHPTENPPGDTVSLAGFIASWLGDQGIPTEYVDPHPTLRSVLSTFNQHAAESLHFMFNGHLDVFPSDDPSLWSIPPFEGRIAEGNVHGRGVGDMKCGLTASLIAYSLLYHLRDQLPARISLMAVADEETGGELGTGWVLDRHPEWLPDACIIGEPCSPDAVRIGEKGISAVTITFEGESYHGSLGVSDNSILRMAQGLLVLQEVVNLKPDIPEAQRVIIDEAMTHNLNEQTRGLELLLRAAVLNVGTIEGGICVNVAPRNVVAQVDIRIPFGLTRQDVLTWARKRLAAAGLSDAELVLASYGSEANYTDPLHPLAPDYQEERSTVLWS